MSLINDMLKDLDRRNYQSIAGNDVTSRGSGRNGTGYQYSSVERFRPAFYTGVIITVLLAGVTLGNSRRAQHTQVPDLSGMASTLLSTFQLPVSEVIATQISATDPSEQPGHPVSGPVVTLSSTDDSLPHQTAVSVIDTQAPLSADTTEQRQPTQKLSQSRLEAATVQPAERQTTAAIPTLWTSPDKIPDKLPVTSIPATLESEDYRQRASGISTIEVVSAQSLMSAESAVPVQHEQEPRQASLETASLLLSPPLAPDVSTIQNTQSDTSTQKALVSNQTTRLPLQKSKIRSHVDSGGTASLQPPRIDGSADNSIPGYIEVTHRPLSAKQQRLQEFRAAASIYKEGNLTDAARQLEDLLVRDNGQHQARLLLARIYSQQNHDSRALSVLSNGLIHYPRHVPYVTLYAQMLAAQGRDDEALTALRHAPSEAHDNADFHALLAGIYQRTGNSSAAADSYLAAIRLDPTRGEWWMGLGISSEQSSDEERAEYAYNEALQYPLSSIVKQYVKQRLQQLAVNRSTSTNNKN